MSERDWFWIRIYTVKSISLMVIALAIAAIVSGGISITKFSTHSQQVNRQK
jgi:hypothetical protein